MYVGKLKLNKEIIATDPCYSLDVWCQLLVDIKPGTYSCYVQEISERIASLELVHENHKIIDYPSLKSNNLGVDSGIFGVFNLDYYSEEDRFDELSDDLFSCGEEYLLLKNGIYCFSGYGDGLYPCYVYLDENNQIDRLKVVFIEGNKSLLELKQEVEDNYEKNCPEGWGKGQFVFNYIESTYNVAKQVQILDKIDCFYDDSKIAAFLLASLKYINNYEYTLQDLVKTK